MERRSRSTTRHNNNGDLNGGYHHHHHHHHRHSARFVQGEPGAPPTSLPPSIALRPGGDSRTLSPDRRNAGREVVAAALKTASYNQYTMQPRLGLQAISSNPPPPMPPRSQPPPLPSLSSLTTSTAPQSTSTPQATPVKYEDFAEGLLRISPSKTAAAVNGVNSGGGPQSKVNGNNNNSNNSNAKTVMMNEAAQNATSSIDTVKKIP